MPQHPIPVAKSLSGNWISLPLARPTGPNTSTVDSPPTMIADRTVSLSVTPGGVDLKSVTPPL